MESSRIEPLRYFDIGDNQVYMMREDLLPFSLGGNKVRIGWEFFCDMRRQEKNCMVVYGNSRSNLCRVLANLCYSRNIPCYMISSREEGEERRETNNSRLMRWFGAHVIPCEKSQIAQTVEETMEMLKGKGYRPYYIYGNKYGTGNEGVPVQAYVNAYDEICSYEAQNGIHFDYIFFPSGTGATQSGLISGHLLKQDQRHIMGILISSRENERARQVIWQGIQDYFQRKGIPLREGSEAEIHLLCQYKAGGYGKYNSEIMQVIREEFCRNGIPLDPTYTGKAFWGMKEYLREKKITDSQILFIHTGGAPLFYDCLGNGDV
ncbi:MAG TPA: pyridoxal-phosphate dependent enzyme [Candidatus Blautia intestinigallinarum]|nr:pyridoxal-phosphate dependent enzyme [Candidatus Blautia intestinigallinarum]